MYHKILISTCLLVGFTSNGYGMINNRGCFPDSPQYQSTRNTCKLFTLNWNVNLTKAGTTFTPCEGNPINDKYTIDGEQNCVKTGTILKVGQLGGPTYTTLSIPQLAKFNEIIVTCTARYNCTFKIY